MHSYLNFIREILVWVSLLGTWLVDLENYLNQSKPDRPVEGTQTSGNHSNLLKPLSWTTWNNHWGNTWVTCEKTGYRILCNSTHCYIINRSQRGSPHHAWNMVRMFCVIMFRSSLDLGDMGKKTRSQGQIIEKTCLQSRDHIFDPIFMRLGQRIFVFMMFKLRLNLGHIWSN